MTKNAWITIIVIVVIIIIGWFIFAGTGNNSATSNGGTSATSPAATNQSNPDNSGVTASSTATGLVSSPIPVKTATEEYTINASNYQFDINSLNVKQGDTVKLTVVNTNGIHDLKIEGYNVGTQILNTGQKETISFVADKRGDFSYYCSVGNHRAMGMVGTLHVVAR